MHVYDKADYHLESVDKAGLPEEHASNHIVPMLRWLIENNLMSEFFTTEGADPLSSYKNGGISIHELLDWWDGCLVSEMLSDRGNAFAMHYFDYDQGAYLGDYQRILQGSLPSEFHVAYSDANYSKLQTSIDKHYKVWLAANEA